MNDADRWFKRYEKADEALQAIHAELYKINIWENQQEQMKRCLEQINRLLKGYEKAEEEVGEQMRQAAIAKNKRSEA